MNARVAGFSLNWVARVTIAAAIGLLFLKWLVQKVPVPGLQRAVAAI